MVKDADVLVDGEPSLYRFTPTNDAAREWLRTRTDGEWFGGGLCCEWRYAADLAAGLRAEGFTVA
jgi:hypothetical protein